MRCDRRTPGKLANGLVRSCFKPPQLARYGVINRLEMLIYSRVNCAFSPIHALSRAHLRGFKTASEDPVILSLVDKRWISVVKRLFQDGVMFI
jgi:hypothetical protein